jgi:hypothetical protein
MTLATDQTHSGERRRTAREVVSSAVGAILGVAPHVLHHVGLIAGSALLTGAAGSALFYGFGLLLSVPMLRRLHRRFRSWRAPALAVAVFSAVFALSNLVVGPALSGTGGSPAPAQQPADEHSSHHS